jgi:branched-chain amino acid transport system permease protein
MKTSTLVSIGLALAIAAMLLVMPLYMGRYGLYVMSMWAVMSIAAIGLNLTLGYAGQISLAQGAFVGIGAYAAGILTTAYGWPLLTVLPLAMVLCFAIGWALGYPALRVQHHYLAFVTLAFSTLAFLVFRNEEWLTKGVYGIENIKRPIIFGWNTFRPLPFYYFTLAALTVTASLTWWIIRSPWGRAFRALRENPLRAQSLGVDTRRYTLMAFAIGSALGGASGVIYAPLVEFIEPGAFTLALSLNILLMVIVGGSGSFFGPFVGALIAILLPEWLRFTKGYYLILYAVLVMVLLAYSPKGILGFVEARLADRRARKASELRASGEPVMQAEARS